MARPRKYRDDLIQRAVSIALEGERPIAQIARDLGIARWPQADRRAGASTGKKTYELEISGKLLRDCE